MRPRRIRDLLLRRLKESPAACLLGPRQSGKTTLAKTLGGRYYDLEQEPDRLRLDLEWEDLVAGRDLVVLDEAQSWPEVFPRLRGAIDRDRKRNGRFLLLGSVSPHLMREVAESLAGRLAIVEMTPFLWTETASRAERDRLWFTGGFPDGGLLDPSAYPRWQRDYLSLLASRDLPAWGLPARPQVTDRLLRMVAALHGQVWNASRVGESLGLSYHTVNGYLDHLVGAFLVRLLPAYRPNLRKRLAARPKVYWRDSGLLHALLSVPDERALLAQPWVGASWEGFVIEQALGELAARGVPFEAYHFRTSDRKELDLVLVVRGEVWAIEIKLTSAPRPEDMKRLDAAADLVRAKRRFLVSRTARTSGDARRLSCDLDGLLSALPEG